LHILTSGQVEPTMEVVARMVDSLRAADAPTPRRRRLVAAAR
jgi:hypothetical protein